MPVLRIASLAIALEGPERPRMGWGGLTPFLDADGGCAPEVRLRWRCLAGLPNPALDGEACVEDLPGGAVAFRRRDFEGRFDPVGGEGRIDTAPSPGALAAALRFVISLGLLERDGLLLHAAALLAPGGVHVLCGPSGAGKSTAAALSQGRATVLSDELSVLRRIAPGTWRAEGTPFSGTLEGGLALGGPLASLALLEQAPRTESAPLAPVRALRCLYAQTFRCGRAPARHARWLALASSLAAEAPCFLLRFRRDPSFWSLLEARGMEMAG